MFVKVRHRWKPITCLMYSDPLAYGEKIVCMLVIIRKCPGLIYARNAIRAIYYNMRSYLAYYMRPYIWCIYVRKQITGSRICSGVHKYTKKQKVNHLIWFIFCLRS